ncbi:ornithine decarboxylase-like [Brevipalpus obovatus]|uniref:ornithine decarboxylase-like n=1 Tax=Brevipalpus obovatus TaxID=246614 RepID=UPI003D9F7001
MFRKRLNFNQFVRTPKYSFRRRSSRLKPMNNKAEKFAILLEDIILENKDTPTIVYDIDDLVKKFKIWNEKMPNIHPYYFVGANRDPLVIKLMSILSRKFSCSSISEIQQVLDEDNSLPILLTNPCKTNGIIVHAFKRNVEYLVFDSESELQKIRYHHPSASLLIRLRIGDPNSSERREQKYGVDVREGKELLQLAKTLNLEVIGVCFHVGTNCTDPNLFTSSLKDAQSMFNTGIDLGFDVWLLNIGGGFPGTSDILKSECAIFNSMAKMINKSLSNFFPKDGNSMVIAEPGRFFVESAVCIVVRIVGKRLVRSSDHEECVHYHINESIFGSLRVHKENQFRPLPEPILSRDDLKKRKICKTFIWGRTCGNQDSINRNIMFPLMDLGEYIMYTHCGAYLSPYFTHSYDNGEEKPRVKYFASDKTRKYLKKFDRFDELSHFFDDFESWN